MTTQLRRLIPLRIALLLAAAGLIAWHLAIEHAALLASPKNDVDIWQPSLSAMSIVSARDRLNGLRGVHPRTLPALKDHQLKDHQLKGQQLKDHQLKGQQLKEPQFMAHQLKQLDGVEKKLLDARVPAGTRRAAALDVYLQRPVPAAAIRKAASPGEAHLWRSLEPGAPVSMAVAKSIEQASRKWDIGWFRDLLLETTYRRAGSSALAAAYRARTHADVERVVLPLGLLAVPILLAAITGIGLSIVALILWRSIPRIPSPLKDAPSLPLVESAAFWILALMFAPQALRPLLRGVSRTAIFWVMPCLELFVGVVGILVMQWWLRTNGAAVSLPSRRDLRLLIRDAGWGIAGFVCIIPWVLAAALLSHAIIGKAGQQGTPDNPVITLMTHRHGTVEVALVFLLASVLAPIFEERFFRGAIYPALRRKMPAWAAACLTGAVFGGIHPQVPLGFLPIFVFGAGLSLLYELRGSTAACIVAHSLNNTMVFLLLIIITRS